MSQKILKILIVEDKQDTRENLANFFSRENHKVIAAENGKIALDKIEKYDFDLIILDLIMAEVNGIEFLEKIKKEYPTKNPKIAIFSAYLNRTPILKCLKFKIKLFFTKPFPAFLLDKFIHTSLFTSQNKKEDFEKLVADNNCFCNSIDNKINAYIISQHEIEDNFKKKTSDKIDKTVTNQEHLLKDYFDKSIEAIKFQIESEEPLFIVARRWNSWYPSFFNVPGGSYAIVCPKSQEDKNEIAVIDPGFKFLSILKSLKISPKNISNCIITHNHPDHIGGIFEYITCRHRLNESIKIYCNHSTHNMFKQLSDQNIILQLLDNKENELFSYKLSNGNCHNLTIDGIETNHEEIGSLNRSLGLKITSKICEDANRLDNEKFKQIIVLGDTEYDRNHNRKSFVDDLIKHYLNFMILHIGCCQMKKRTAKHLYLPGIKKLLNDIDSKLDEIEYEGKLPIIVSEWGLEHANKTQIKKICPSIENEFEEKSLIIETILFLQQSLDKITLIPGDIGLIIGMHSKKIYLKDNISIEPEKLKFKMNSEGIVYYK